MTTIEHPFQTRQRERRNARRLRRMEVTRKEVKLDTPVKETKIEKLLTTNEVSLKLGLSLKALEHRRRAGTGPEFIKQGQKVFYKASSVETYQK